MSKRPPQVHIFMRRLGEYEWEGQRLGWGKIMDVATQLYPKGFEVVVETVAKPKRQRA